MRNGNAANLLISYLHEVSTMLMVLRDQDLRFNLSDCEIEYVDHQMLRIDLELAHIRRQVTVKHADPFSSIKACCQPGHSL